MATQIYPLVVDLSHWDEVTNWASIAQSGIVGVIYKATEGTGYVDETYASAKKSALAAGLLWGSYHFLDDEDPVLQAKHYLEKAEIGPDELFCCDYEEYGDNSAGRVGQCVLYSGNWIKETGTNDSFWAEHRLWLAQYGTTPEVPDPWSEFWLWQYTGDGQGPEPHSVPGISGAAVDINSYQYGREQLAAEWSGGTIPEPPPTMAMVTVTIEAPANVLVNVKQVEKAPQALIAKRQSDEPRRR
jgi:lysozyme